MQSIVALSIISWPKIFRIFTFLWSCVSKVHSIVQTQQLKKIQQTETWRKIKWWIVFLMEGLYKPQHRAVAKHTTKKWKNSGLESLNWFADRWAFLSLLYVCYWKKLALLCCLLGCFVIYWCWQKLSNCSTAEKSHSGTPSGP